MGLSGNSHLEEDIAIWFELNEERVFVFNAVCFDDPAYYDTDDRQNERNGVYDLHRVGEQNLEQLRCEKEHHCQNVNQKKGPIQLNLVFVKGCKFLYKAIDQANTHTCEEYAHENVNSKHQIH